MKKLKKSEGEPINLTIMILIENNVWEFEEWCENPFI